MASSSLEVYERVWDVMLVSAWFSRIWVMHAQDWLGMPVYVEPSCRGKYSAPEMTSRDSLCAQKRALTCNHGVGLEKAADTGKNTTVDG